MSNKKNVTMLFSMGLVLLLAAGYFLVISPFLDRGAESSQEIENAKMQRETAQLALATAQNYEKAYAPLTDINNTLETQFPSTADIESLNNSIVQAATRAGIPGENITSITTTSPDVIALEVPVEEVPAEEVPAEEAPEEVPAEDAVAPPTAEEIAANSPMARMEVSITVEGDMQALYDFVGYLQEMDRVILITSSVSTHDAEGGTGTVSIRAFSYLYVALDDPLTEDATNPSMEEGIAGQEATETEGTEIESTQTEG